MKTSNLLYGKIGKNPQHYYIDNGFSSIYFEVTGLIGPAILYLAYLFLRRYAATTRKNTTFRNYAAQKEGEGEIDDEDVG